MPDTIEDFREQLTPRSSETHSIPVFGSHSPSHRYADESGRDSSSVSRESYRQYADFSTDCKTHMGSIKHDGGHCLAASEGPLDTRDVQEYRNTLHESPICNPLKYPSEEALDTWPGERCSNERWSERSEGESDIVEPSEWIALFGKYKELAPKRIKYYTCRSSAPDDAPLNTSERSSSGSSRLPVI